MVHGGLIRSLPEILLWALGRRERYRVRGQSMRPALPDGAFVLVDPRAYAVRAPRPGEVVLARHPFRTDVRLVKRVAHATQDGRLALAGDDHEASTDSRDFGTVALSQVMGRVVLRLT